MMPEQTPFIQTTDIIDHMPGFEVGHKKTAADVSGDRKARKRALQDKKYLIINNPERGWGFPEGVFEAEDVGIKQTGQRVLLDYFGFELICYWPGNSPVGSLERAFAPSHPLASEYQGDRLFFMYACVLDGNPVRTHVC
jgi:hypothetical protein